MNRSLGTRDSRRRGSASPRTHGDRRTVAGARGLVLRAEDSAGPIKIRRAHGQRAVGEGCQSQPLMSYRRLSPTFSSRSARASS
jgi:hypothetical protein